MLKFKDLVRGDTRRFRVVFQTDLTGATGKMTWRLTKSDADPGVLQVTGVLAPAGAGGVITSMIFDLTKTPSAALTRVIHYTDFELTRESGEDIKTIRGQITVVSGGG